jgi:hypothetical protein
MHVRGSAAPDNQRLEAPRAVLVSSPYDPHSVDVGVGDLALDERLCRESAVTTPLEIIPYYHPNHSIWSLSDNKESSR